MFRTFDAGATSPSSQFTTGNAAILQGHINVTSTGQLRLRFASEINTSAITVTDVNGYLRRLY
jgi:phage-related minor tail protein